MENLLFSAVVAAFISAIVSGVFNVLVANNVKKRSDIHLFRYTKLYDLNNEILSLKAMNYDLTDMQSLANQSSERHGLVTDIYKKSSPLLKNNVCKTEADSCLNEAENLSNELVSAIYDKKKVSAEKVPFKELLLKRQEFEKKAKEAISQSMRELLK